jgi:hypothetical protein
VAWAETAVKELAFAAALRLPHTGFFAGGDFLDINNGASHAFIEPTSAARDGRH